MIPLIKDFKYLFLIEILLFVVFIKYDYPVFFVFLGLIILLPVFYYLYERPILLLNLFLLMIFAGALGKINMQGKIPKLLVIDIFFPILFTIFVFKVVSELDNSKKCDFISKIFPLFLFWILMGFLVAVDVSRALNVWKSYFYGFIVFLFTYRYISTAKELKRMVIFLIFFGVVLSLIEIEILIELGGLSTGLLGLFLKKNLLATSWGKSNYLATFYVLLIPITIGYYLSIVSVKRKTVVAISLLFMFFALILTLSRGGFLALGISIIFLLARILKPKTFLPILITTCLIVILLLFNPLTYVIINRLSTVEQSFSYFSRINFYKDVWNTFLRNPIIGVGLGNLGYHAKFIILEHASAHNIILGLLGETGVPGAVLFISMLIYIGKTVAKAFVKSDNEIIRIFLWAFLSALLGVFIHSMMEPNFEGPQFSIIFWCTVAIFLRYIEISKQDKLAVFSFN